MDIKYYNYLIDRVKLRPMDQSLSSNKRQNIQCVLCDDIFSATPKSKVSNFKKYRVAGCPKCTRMTRYNSINDENKQKLEERFEILSDYGNNNYTQLTVKNKECGHVFTARKGNLLNRGVVCSVCNTIKKRKFYRYMNDMRHRESLLQKSGYAQYKQLVYKLTRETYRIYKDKINPQNLARVLPKIHVRETGYHLDHIISVKYCFQNNIPAEICADYRNLCMTEWRANIIKNQKPNIRFPEIFYPYIKSIDKIAEFIKTVNSLIPIVLKPYADFGKFMITLYDSIENRGLMFITLNEYRQQTIRTKYYFRDMKRNLDENGIHTLFIFEDEWINNRELVIQKIKHYFKLNITTEKIHARKCIVREISPKQKTLFLKENHIQGTAISKVSLGAFYEDNLIAVMTFSNPRIAMNKYEILEKKKWELVRFATNNHYRVVGIASKLLSYFEENYDWEQIYSFADRRWSEGNVYYKLGFSLAKVNPPEYFYIVDGKRKHRYNFRKDILKEKFKDLYNAELTEYQNMLSLGYDRIWDCGTLKFVKAK